MARGEVVPTRQDAPGETTRYSGTPGMLEDPVYGEARVATLSGRISEATDVLAEDSRTPFSPSPALPARRGAHARRSRDRAAVHALDRGTGSPFP